MKKVSRINEKAKSKSQQRLFGMVTAYKDGKLKLGDLPDSLAKKIKGIADGQRKKTGDKRKKTKGISKRKAKDYAKTKHKGLPETIDENKEFNREEYIDLIYSSSKFEIDELEEMTDIELKKLTKSLEINSFNDILEEEEEFNVYENKTIIKFNDFINESFNNDNDIVLFDKNNGKELIISFDDKAIITNIVNNIGVDTTFDIGDELYYPDFINDFYNKVKDIISFIPETKSNLIKLASINTKNRNLTESIKVDELEIKEPMSIEEIAKKHDVAIEYIESILPEATNIEMEHTDDPDLALKIALHHLEETILYYDDDIGLPNMEEELEDLDDEEIEDIVEDRLKNKIVKFDDFKDEEED